MRARTVRAGFPRQGFLLVSALLMAPVQSVSALPSGAAKGASQSRLSLEEVAIMLSSSEQDEVRMALEATARLRAAEVVPLLEERVRQGLPPALLESALASLELLADRTATPLLVELTRHRRVAIRVQAVSALGRLRAGAPALTRALGDLAPEVRSAAATALGELGPTAELPPLLRALSLGVEGAAAAVGRVARNEHIDGLLPQVAQADPRALKPMFSALLTRRDIGEAEQLRCIDALANTGGEAGRALLGELLTELPQPLSPRIRKALVEGAQRGAPP